MDTNAKQLGCVVTTFPRNFARCSVWLHFVCFAGSPALMAAPADWAPVLNTTAAWNSNAPNADRPVDVIGALQIHAELTASRRLSLGRDDALFLGGQLGAESWPRFDGLDRAALGPRFAWQHKFGLGALAPVFRVDVGADGVAARESDRAGFAASALLSWRQRFEDNTRVALTYEFARHDARATVFDRTGGEAALEVARTLDERWELVVTARWREGDVLSYATPPRPDLVELARVRATVNTFGQPRVAYSLDARTLGGSLALSRSLNEMTSLTFAYDYRRTTRSELGYVNHLVSVVLTRQF